MNNRDTLHFRQTARIIGVCAVRQPAIACRTPLPSGKLDEAKGISESLEKF